MINKEYTIPFNAPLNPLDTENQTFGCRQNNPEICGKNNLLEICAFCRSDHVCKMPSRAWKKQFLKLSCRLVQTLYSILICQQL